jgi:hypothetical protein
MPTANANTGTSFSAVLSYVEKTKDKRAGFAAPVRLVENQCYGERGEIAQQMAEQASERPACKKPVLHFQINFHPDEKLAEGLREQAALRVLEHVGVSEALHQFTVHEHFDKAHPHFHVVLNRVGLDGSLFPDHQLLNRLQVACDRTERELGLRQTTGRTVVYAPEDAKGFRYVPSSERKVKSAADLKPDKRAGVQQKKEKLHSMVSYVLEQEKPKTAEAFGERLRAKGVEVEFKTNKNGIFGVSFKLKGSQVAFKGSDIGYKWAQIRDSIGLGQEQAVRVAVVASNSASGQKISLKGSLSDDELKALLKTAYLTLSSGKYRGGSVDAISLADQACREYGKRFDPVHVWRAWHALPDNESLWIQLHELAKKEEILLSGPSANDRLLAEQRLIAASNDVLAVLRQDLQSGLVNVGFEKIMQQAGFKEDLQGNWKIQTTGNIQLEVPFSFLLKISDAILANQALYQAFEQQKQAYDLLMARQPAAIGWAERFSGKAGSITTENEALLAAQKRAVQPVFVADLKDLQVLPQVDSLLAELQDKAAFRDSLRLELAQIWENSGGQALDMDSVEGFYLVQSATNQVIQDRQLDQDLLTSSDRQMIAGFVFDIFSGLSKLGFAAGQSNDQPELRRKRKW